jgi:signal transduction histidine kinase
MKLYRQAGNIKAGLFLGAVLLIVGLFIYTQSIIEKLRNENRETVSFHVKLFAKGISEAEGDELDFFFREIIQPISFPIIIADKEGNPQQWRNLPNNDDLSVDNVREHLKDMAEENEPIPLIIYLEEFGTTKDLELGFIYFGDSTLISRLRVLPYIEIGMVTVFVLLGFIGFQAIRKNEKRHIWVGTARETAHQLGTPVSSLMGWLDRLVEHPEESAQLAEEMSKDVNRLQRISDRFARMGSRPKLERIEVQQLLDETADYFRDRLPSNKSITLEVADAGDAAILGTPTLISWALENLVKNGIDSLDKPDGKVSLSATQEGSNVVLKIADNGKGIRRRDWKNVFRPGYSTKEHGWGLGLSLTRRIIEEFQNGAVRVLSSEVGVGATFEIRIPAA